MTIRQIKILGVSLSARQQSNSERLLGYVLSRIVHENGQSWSCSRISLAECTFECIGCERCFSNIQAHSDGISQICRKMLDADVVIFSTPNFYGMPPGPGKVLMDRTDPLWGLQRLRGKLGAVIVNGASVDERLDRCKDNVNAYFDAHGMVVIPNCPVFGGSKDYVDQRFPDPLPEHIRIRLDRFAGIICKETGLN